MIKSGKAIELSDNVRGRWRCEKEGLCPGGTASWLHKPCHFSVSWRLSLLFDFDIICLSIYGDDLSWNQAPYLRH